MEKNVRKKVRGLELGQSREDYLEAIFVLSRSKDIVRVVHIADYLGYSKPSVSVAVKRLMEMGYINRGTNGGYALTEKGKLLAEKIYERHGFFQKFLLYIGVSDEVAERDACSVEHALSDESFLKLKKYVEKRMIEET